MSFDDLESSRQAAAPITLYLFRYGSRPQDVFAYTDAEQGVIHAIDGEDYAFAPIPISRSEITSSGSLEKSTLTVRTAHSSPLAVFFVDNPPSQVVSLLVLEGHAGADDFIIVWMGRVLGSAQEANETVYNCEPGSIALKRVGLTRNYQLQCPHLLYGDQCRASQAAATHSVSALNIVGARLTLAGGWNAGADLDAYNGGLAIWTASDGRTERRSIIEATSTSILLSSTTKGLNAGDAIDVVLGCNHRMDHCLTLHANIHNYGGQPFIPTKNPFGIKNEFY